MYHELLRRYGRSHWRVAIDALDARGYTLYDRYDFIRVLITPNESAGWQAQVIFLERVQSWSDFPTPLEALEFALERLAEEAK